MKTKLNNPSRRLVAAVGMVVVLVGVILAVVLAGTAPAQASAPSLAQPNSSRTPPPPLNPPIQTPEPGKGPTVRVSAGADSSLRAIPFRTKLQITRGQPNAGPQIANRLPKSNIRPAGPGHTPGPQSAYTPPDYKNTLSAQAWNLLLYEDFELIFPNPSDPNWYVFDNDDVTNGEYYWDDVSTNPQWGAWSAWAAAGGADGQFLDPLNGYPNDMQSWMAYGPLDFSGYTDAFVSFGLWFDTEPDYDWMYFCLSIDGFNFNCDYWAGWSEGWTDQAYWLTSYAGYSEVWVAWLFESDSSIGGADGYYGPYVDEIYVWGDDGTVPPTPTPDLNGQQILNGGFETGDLTNWNVEGLAGMSAPGEAAAPAPGLRPDTRPALASGNAPKGEVGIQNVAVITDTYAEGVYSAYLWLPPDTDGYQYLYQTFQVSPTITSLTLDYWFAMVTSETEARADYFCASLRPGGVPITSTISVDLGCIDGVESAGYWQEVVFVLDGSQLAAISGLGNVALVFELYNNTYSVGPVLWTDAYVDYVNVYATGAGAGAALDLNEPNNDLTEATLLTCGQPITTSVIGDVYGGYDIDVFQLLTVPAGPLNIDIDARTLVPPSALDSVVYLYDSNGNVVDYNDDDGITYDSYISFTVPVTGQTYYASVESYTGEGSPDSFYNVTANCEGAGGAPPAASTVITPTANTWTVMLYLNAEDPNFAATLTGYRTAIEGFIGSKSAFLTVTVLYDAPGVTNTTRYLVQPGGAYTPDVNRWDMGELNMGSQDTLADFVNWSMDQYPAENYYLAIDDHGNGVYGISWDPSSTNDQLTPPEVYSALKDATHNGGRKISIFDYEACLLGLAENAYDMREWVDYVVFSEQISWGITTYPVYFNDLAAADTPLTVGQRIVNRYSTGATAAEYPHTISLIDTSQMAALNTALNAFGDALQATGVITPVNQARDASQAFAANNDATNYVFAEYIDLWDLADKASARGLAPTQAAAVKAAVDAAVVAERHVSGGIKLGPTTYSWNHNGAHGLSIYYPYDRASSAFTDYTTTGIYRMSADGTWDDFLSWVVPGSALGGGRGGMGSSRAELKLSGGTTFILGNVYLPLVQK